MAGLRVEGHGAAQIDAFARADGLHCDLGPPLRLRLREERGEPAEGHVAVDVQVGRGALVEIDPALESEAPVLPPDFQALEGHLREVPRRAECGRGERALPPSAFQAPDGRAIAHFPGRARGELESHGSGPLEGGAAVARARQGGQHRPAGQRGHVQVETHGPVVPDPALAGQEARGLGCREPEDLAVGRELESDRRQRASLEGKAAQGHVARATRSGGRS